MEVPATAPPRIGCAWTLSAPRPWPYFSPSLLLSLSFFLLKAASLSFLFPCSLCQRAVPFFSHHLSFLCANRFRTHVHLNGADEFRNVSFKYIDSRGIDCLLSSNMHFPSKISVALVVSLAAVGEAVHPLHLHQARRYGNSTNVITSSILVIPTPLEKASESITTPPVALSTGLAGAVPVPEQDPNTEDLTLTYTLGAGTSTTVVTTTIHRTATQTHYVVQVCGIIVQRSIIEFNDTDTSI